VGTFDAAHTSQLVFFVQPSIGLLEQHLTSWDVVGSTISASFLQPSFPPQTIAVNVCSEGVGAIGAEEIGAAVGGTGAGVGGIGAAVGSTGAWVGDTAQDPNVVDSEDPNCPPCFSTTPLYSTV